MKKDDIANKEAKAGMWKNSGETVKLIGVEVTKVACKMGSWVVA